jgi:hypothetical protein
MQAGAFAYTFLLVEDRRSLKSQPANTSSFDFSK